MTNNEIKLPPRKWYSLQQAAEKLTRDTKEPVTVDDLLHFYITEKLELAVYISHYPARTTIGNIEFSSLKSNNSNLRKNNLMFNILGYDGEEIELNNIFSMRTGAKEESTHHFLKTRTSSNDKSFNEFIYISGFMLLWSTLSIDPKKAKQLREKGIMLNNINYLIPPNNEKENSIAIQIAIKNYTEDVYIPISEFYILENELDNFINEKTKHRNIENIIKNKGGRPKQYTNEIQELGKKIFERYPDNNRESIAKAIDELINNKNYLNDQNPNISIQKIRRDLRSAEIGKIRGKSIKIRNLLSFINK